MANNVKEEKLVKLNYAFKLAEQWVNNMSQSPANETPTSVELEGRSSRLGIGATVPKESSKFMRTNNPVERKLLSKVQSSKRKAIEVEMDMKTSARDVQVDSEEEELDSKTKAFAKKSAASRTTHTPSKKLR